MTWVIGASSSWGIGAMLSDVRVSWANGHSEDLIKKAHPLGPCISGGFAGSVKIGYLLLDDFSQRLIKGIAKPNTIYDPVEASRAWAPTAAQLFQQAHEEEKILGCEILLVGLGLEHNGIPFLPRIVQVKLTAPSFEPQIELNMPAACHIGSGGAVKAYTDAIAEWFNPTNSFSIQLQVRSGQAWVHFLGNAVNTAVSKTQDKLVSPHVHILIWSRDGLAEGTNDTTNSDGTSFKMPDVAKTYQEFLERCEARSITANGAIA